MLAFCCSRLHPPTCDDQVNAPRGRHATAPTKRVVPLLASDNVTGMLLSSSVTSTLPRASSALQSKTTRSIRLAILGDGRRDRSISGPLQIYQRYFGVVAERKLRIGSIVKSRRDTFGGDGSHRRKSETRRGCVGHVKLIRAGKHEKFRLGLRRATSVRPSGPVERHIQIRSQYPRRARIGPPCRPRMHATDASPYCHQIQSRTSDSGCFQDVQVEAISPQPWTTPIGSPMCYCARAPREATPPAPPHPPP